MIDAVGLAAHDDDFRLCRRHNAARAVFAYRDARSDKRLAWDKAAVEDQLAPAQLNSVAGQRDHALDQVGIFDGMMKDDDIAAVGHMAENLPLQRREAEGEAVAGITVGPFGHHEIIADVERRTCRVG